MPDPTPHTLPANLQQFGTPPLTIELVPKTCFFSNVRSHVEPEVWDKLRKSTYRQANYTCQICGGRGPTWPVECHEIWYYDDLTLTQRLDGLIALCPLCHQTKHLGLAGMNNKGEEVMKHLAKVNNWSEPHAEQYLKLIWDLWMERSREQWKLDLRWLELVGVYITPER